MRRRELTCPYDHPGHAPAAVLVIRPNDHALERRFGGRSLSPRIVRGADVHCTVCHYESWIRVDDDWRPGDLSQPRECSCGETYL
jgi:hypothetical protein